MLVFFRRKLNGFYSISDPLRQNIFNAKKSRGAKGAKG